MKITRKGLLLLSFLLLACLAFAACTGGDTPTDTTAGDTTAAADPVTNPSTEAPTEPAETEPLIMGNGYGVLIHDDGTFTVGLLNGEEKTFEPRSTTVRDLERIQAGMTFFDAVACGGIPHDGLTSGRVSTCFNASDGSSCLVYWTYNGDGEMIVSGVHIYS